MAMMQKLRATGRLLRSSPSQLTWSRSFAADAHGPAKIPMWADPMSPSKWKEEHDGELFSTVGTSSSLADRARKRQQAKAELNRAQKAWRG